MNNRSWDDFPIVCQITRSTCIIWVTIWVTLSMTDELRDRTGAYLRTCPHLAQNVYFPGYRKNERDMIRGLHDNAARLNSSPYYSHIMCPNTGSDTTRTHFGMIRNPELLNRLFRRMLGWDKTDTRQIIAPEDLLSGY